jgi:hypothetical protein
MTNEMAIIIGAVIGGSFGVLGNLITAAIARRTAQRKRADELFSTALNFLGGGTQRRNLGIAAITLYWRLFPEHKQLCVEMLIGSAIYLLNESKQEDKSHELFNLHRIMDLLQEMSIDGQKGDGYKRLEEVVGKRIQDFTQEPERGLWVTLDDLEDWKKNLKGKK